MLEILESFPEQCRVGANIGRNFNIPVSYRLKYKNIVCAGLGGSAIGADFARSYLAGEANTPIIVNRNYSLPRFVNSDSLVIAMSYSGNTEETISAYKDAKTKGAKLIVITSGGELRRMAEKDGYTCLTIPGGLPPRCALGYSFFPLIAVLSKIGLIGDKSASVNRTIKSLENLRNRFVGTAAPESKNIAKKIASALYGKVPVIYASQDRIDIVATRWRGQLAENAKVIASSNFIPEMNHNEIMGWENPAAVIKKMVVVMLRDKSDNPRISKRMDITMDMIVNEGVQVVEVESIGEDLLERMFSLIYIGDFATFYLAIHNRTDPTSIDRINYLKERLAE